MSTTLHDNYYRRPTAESQVNAADSCGIILLIFHSRGVFPSFGFSTMRFKKGEFRTYEKSLKKLSRNDRIILNLSAMC